MIIGIDLGTTNSVCAVWKDGQTQLIPNSFGEFLTPSVISFEKSGQILVGKGAKTRAALFPTESAKNFKRYMGSERLFKFHKNQYSPVELSALLLKNLIADAESFLGESVSEAVISVPAYFNGIQRKATKQAAELAGIKVEKLINEPTAAAIAYGLQDKPEYTDFMIIDLGGGTFDVSIMEYFEGILEVKASSGDNFLGGEDFLQVIVELYLKKIDLGLQRLSPKDKQLLYSRMEQLKKEIGSKKPYVIEPFLSKKTGTVELDYETIKQASGGLLRKAARPIELCLQDSQIAPSEIDEVILVGGASRMGFFKSMVTRMFKKIPRTDIDPDLTIAIGAAIQAGLKAKDESLGDVVLTDVSPYTLGTGVVNHNDPYDENNLIFDPIIERNTVVPTSRVKSYVTAADFQKKINMDVFQGESRLVKNNINLGSLNIKVPSNKAGKERVELRFSYDVNGLLEVDAMVISTGEKFQKVINNSPGELSDKEIDKSRSKLAKLKFHPRDGEKVKELIMRAEAIYENSLDDDRYNISNALSEFEQVLDKQDPDEIKLISEKFEAFLLEFENQRWFE